MAAGAAAIVAALLMSQMQLPLNRKLEAGCENVAVLKIRHNASYTKARKYHDLSFAFYHSPEHFSLP
jgi:hypothetical protein